MSPELWNPVLREMTVGWSYEAWDVPAGASMAEVRAKLLETDVVAANVTMPHKQWAAGAGETVTDPVRLSGAANLLVRHEKQLEAHNTEMRLARESFLTALQQQRSDFREELAAKRESVASLAQTIEKLSEIMVDHDRAMRAAHDHEVRDMVQEIVRNSKGS